MFMKRILVVILTLCVSIVLISCSKDKLNASTNIKESQNKITNEDNIEKSINHAEYLTDKNKNLIGTEIQESGISSQNDSKENLNSIPYKNIISSTDEKVLPPSSIDEFILKEENNKYITPEIITVNGSMSLFIKKDGSGIKLNKGQSLTINFNKYKSKSQNILIGYILNGKMMNGKDFADLSGSYTITATESGEYYLYIINASSDYVAFKEGNIVISES